ncbi:MAG: arsenate reductase (azurin) small subunit [Jannaschia sp.]
MSRTEQRPQPAHLCMARREFLILGGASVVSLGTVGEAGAQLVGSSYPRKVVGTLSGLQEGTAVEFTYPNEETYNLLFKLGEIAGGGIGEARDVVAFNQQCTHQGAWMDVSHFQARHAVLGPCPLHLSTFDLTKFGMIVSGHATSSLPQITLELDDDDIVATGVQGLIWGYSVNPRA